MITPKESRWISLLKPNGDARLRLFCFPFAGGAASAFRGWQAALPADIELCPIQYPGREDRFHEPLITDLNNLIAALTAEFKNFTDLPHAFFGHSMGAIIAFELARALKRNCISKPVHLFVSASSSPGTRERDEICQLPDDQFIDRLRQYGGTPQLVLENKELMEIFLPILRADFTMLDNYQYEAGILLDCPITALIGDKDESVTPAKIEGWQQMTTGSFKLHTFPGNHFYLQSARAQVMAMISSYLSKDL